MTERAFARSFSSVFSARHPIRDSEVREHWQILARRGSSIPVSPRLVRYIAERKVHAARWEGALERCSVPRVFLWGMSDPASGAHIAEHIRRRLPRTPLTPLPEVGHYPQLEVPDLVAKEISAVFSGDS
jgi:pimeloyl-ACP methyl ester carboxylesterase